MRGGRIWEDWERFGDPLPLDEAWRDAPYCDYLSGWRPAMGKEGNVQGCCVLLCSKSRLVLLQTPEKSRERRKCQYVVNGSILADCFCQGRS